MTGNMAPMLITDNKTSYMKRLLTAFFSTIVFISCNDTSESPSPTAENKDSTNKYAVSVKPFGDLAGETIMEYTLTNPSGMQVSIINYGGTVTRLLAPDKNKQMGDVVLGFDSLSGFLQKANPYFGSLVGRYANRIAAGKFTLDGKTYTLA